MEIIKKKIYKKKSQQTFNLYPHEFFFTLKMIEPHNLPQDIITRIRQYCLLLRHEDFKNKFTCMNQWHDSFIPTKYQYLLSSQQINILENLFKDKPKYSKFNGYIYILPSTRIYKKFLTLPIELRKCLREIRQPSLSGYYAYHHGAIAVIDREVTPGGFGQINSREIIKHKPILPENKAKNHKK